MREIEDHTLDNCFNRKILEAVVLAIICAICFVGYCALEKQEQHYLEEQV